MTFPVLFAFPQEPAGSCFNWTYFTEIHLPLAVSMYQDTSFDRIDVVEFGPEDPYQVIALSYFEEQDFMGVDLTPLWDDVPKFTGTKPGILVVPGEFVGSFD